MVTIIPEDLKKFFSKSIKTMESAWLSSYDIEYDLEVAYHDNDIIAVSKIKRKDTMIKKIVYMSNEYDVNIDLSMDTSFRKLQSRDLLNRNLEKIENTSIAVPINAFRVFITKFKITKIEDKEYKSSEVSKDYSLVLFELMKYFEKYKKVYK